MQDITSYKPVKQGLLSYANSSPIPNQLFLAFFSYFLTYGYPVSFFCSSSSLSVGTPNFTALSYFEPASSPKSR